MGRRGVFCGVCTKPYETARSNYCKDCDAITPGTFNQSRPGERWKSYVQKETGCRLTIYDTRQVYRDPRAYGKLKKQVSYRRDYPDLTDEQWWKGLYDIRDWEEEQMAQFEAVEKFGPFQSRSGSGEYHVQLNKSGIISCNCKGWAIYKGRPRSCTHTDQVIRQKGWDTYSPQGSQYILLRNTQVQAVKQFLKQTPEQKLQVLIDAYEKAVEFMAKQPLDKVISAAMQVEEAKFKVEGYVAMMKKQGVALQIGVA